MKKRLDNYRSRQYLWLVATAVLLVIITLVALQTGAINIDLSGLIPFPYHPEGDLSQRIIWQVRMPRICGALIGGAGFAATGTALQTILRNPLASPSTLGISQGAAFGSACGVIFIGLLDTEAGNQALVLSNHPYLISCFAFVSSVITTFCIILLASIYRADRETIVLAGVALGAFFMAGSTILQYFADETQLASIISWTFGDVGRASWTELRVMFLVVIGGFIFFYSQALKFNALLLSTDTAASLGVSVVRLRLFTIAVSALITAIIVTFFGIISFIGLVAPHIARRLVGERVHILLPMASLLGALTLLCADLIGRSLLAPVVLPAGVITAFMGTPIFLFLLFGGKGR